METPTLIREVAARLGSDERHAAAITAAVLHELRDRLSDGSTPPVPTGVARVLMPLWTEIEPHACTNEQPYRLGLLGDVMERGALPDAAAAERAVVVVFAAVRRMLDGVAANARAMPKLLTILPPDLQFFWTAADEHHDDLGATHGVGATTTRRRTRAAKRGSWSSAA